ncbi:ABC transporter for multidrug [Chlamydia abortus]|nr:ABC transporter for multidrug [Chlamydia abortus]
MESVDEKFLLEGASVYFRKGSGSHEVLSNIHISISKGEWIGIVGRNGSGKSTLAKVLSGSCPLSAGTIKQGWVNGRRIGMIGQQPDAQIVGETLYEDVCFLMENEAVEPAKMPDKAEQALSRVGLNLPLDHPVGELSGGQKQLLAVAGWLVTDTAVLVFDEATAMLDPASRLNVLHIAQELKRAGTTIIWITQWMEELAWADRVVALDRGKLVFDGTVPSFFYGEDVTAQDRDRSRENHSHADDVTPCQRLGYEQPYAVQVARSLRKRNIRLPSWPVTVEQLGEAVEKYGSTA